MNIRKKIVSGILTGLLLSTLLIQSVAAENLLKNPDFSEIKDNKSAPVGWEFHSWKDIGKIEISKEKGKNIVTLSSEEDTDTRLLQSFSFKKDVTYKLSAKVKAKVNATDRSGAILSMYMITDTSKSLYDTKGKWENLSFYFKCNADMTKKLSFGLGGHSNVNSGSVSYKDVKLEIVDAVPSGNNLHSISDVAPHKSSSTPQKEEEFPVAIVIIIVVLVVVALAVVVYFQPKKKFATGDELSVEDSDDDSSDVPTEPTSDDDFDQLD